MQDNSTSIINKLIDDVNATMVTTSGAQEVNSAGLQPEIFGNTAVALMTAAAVYLLLSLIVYHFRSQSKCKAIVVFHICTGVAALSSLISEQFELQLGKEGDIYCRIYTWFTSSFYFLGIMSAFSLLWIRQRSLYSSSLLRAYNGRFWEFLSKYIIVGIWGVFLLTGVLVSVSIELVSTEEGCIMHFGDEENEGSVGLDLFIIIGILVAFGVLFQFVLLALIVYPLRKSNSINDEETQNRKKRRPKLKLFIPSISRKAKSFRHGSFNPNSSNGSSSPKADDDCFASTAEYSTNPEAKFHKCLVTSPNQIKSPTCSTRTFSQSVEDMEKSSKALIRRLVVSTVVCITSELLSAGIASICLAFAPDSYWSLVIHFDLLINLVTVTLSFVNWKERLFPYGKVQKNPFRRITRIKSDPSTVVSVITPTR